MKIYALTSTVLQSSEATFTVGHSTRAPDILFFTLLSGAHSFECIPSKAELADISNFLSEAFPRIPEKWKTDAVRRSRLRRIELTAGDRCFSINYANRADPYREGLEISVVARGECRVLGFFPRQEACKLRNLLAKHFL